MPYKDLKKRKEFFRQYVSNNREKINAYHRRWEADNPTKVKNFHLKKEYGITNDQYLEMLTKQHGVCAICMKPEDTKINGKLTRLSVDHDHTTGKVRDLLCRKCNVVLGQIGDSVGIAQAIVLYLEKHSND